MDSHEPEGEWDIEVEVSAEDLLESNEYFTGCNQDTLQPHPEGIMRTSILTPKSVYFQVKKNEITLVDEGEPFSCQPNCGKCCDEPGALYIFQPLMLGEFQTI